MPTPAIEISRKSKSATHCQSDGAKPASRRKIKPAPAPTPAAFTPSNEPLPEERVTKQERVLTLLSRPMGASIDDMMAATGWQTHSVRGFLAGTVKTKLGFTLTSTKAERGVRRYRIEKKRGR